MQLRRLVRAGAARCSFVLTAIFAVACDQTFPGSSVTLTNDDAGTRPTYGPTGSTVAVKVIASANSKTGGTALGLPINFAAQPATITMSPASVIAGNDGSAVAYAFVPYGTTGVVIVSATDANPIEIPVSTAPLTLCTAPAQATGHVGSTGTIYSVTATALAAGECLAEANTAGGADSGIGTASDAGTDAPAKANTAGAADGGVGTASDADTDAADARPEADAEDGSAIQPVSGVPLSFTLIQTSGGAGASGTSSASSSSSSDAAASAGGGASSSSLLTAANGQATAYLTVPWGSDVVVQVVGGGATTWVPISGVGNPLALTSVCWQPYSQQGIYEIQASVTSAGASVPGAPVTFSIIFPFAAAGIVSPATDMTNGFGIATTYLAVPDAASLPITMTAAAGTSVFPVTVGGSQGVCPCDASACGVDATTETNLGDASLDAGEAASLMKSDSATDGGCILGKDACP